MKKYVQLFGGGYAIVVVDNGSPNKSGEVLKQKYGDHKQIEVIMNSSNAGFARGNNLGFDFVRNKYKPKFIIVMNNDILIEQENFLERIESVYQETKFDVLGPDILSVLTGEHQNPMCLRMPSYKKFMSWYEDTIYKCNHPYVSYLRWKIRSYAERVLNKVLGRKSNAKSEEVKNGEEMVINPVLQGACYIFGPKFVKRREYCFNPSTLFYGEEWILYQECVLQGMKTIYDPALKVLHLQGETTRKNFKTDFARYKLRNAGLKVAYGLLIKLMNPQLG